MAVRLETELYGPVKAFFETLGYEVKSEVRSCDLVAVKPGTEEEPIIVELKKTFNLPLIYQGIERLAMSDNVYLAVEITDDLRRKQSKKWAEAVKLCRRLGLGLLTVRFYKAGRKPRVDMLCDTSPYAPRKAKNRTKRLLKEFQNRTTDFNTGGSTRIKLMTAYREKALECAYWLREKGPLRPRDLRDLTAFAQAQQLLYHNYYGWFVREQTGIYALTPKGSEALNEYSYVLERKFADLDHAQELPQARRSADNS